jgi:hypothetical protein
MLLRILFAVALISLCAFASCAKMVPASNTKLDSAASPTEAKAPQIPPEYAKAHAAIEEAWKAVDTEPDTASAQFLAARDATIRAWIQKTASEGDAGTAAPLLSGFGKWIQGKGATKLDPVAQWLLLESFAGRAKSLQQSDASLLWEENSMIATAQCPRAQQARCKELRLLNNEIMNTLFENARRGKSTSEFEQLLHQWKRDKQKGTSLPAMYTIVLDDANPSNGANPGNGANLGNGTLSKDMGGRATTATDCDQWFDILAEDHMKTMQRVARARWCKKHLRTTPKLKLLVKLDDGYRPKEGERLHLWVFPDSLTAKGENFELRGRVVGRFGIKTEIKGGVRSVAYPIQVNGVDFQEYAITL